MVLSVKVLVHWAEGTMLTNRPPNLSLITLYPPGTPSILYLVKVGLASVGNDTAVKHAVHYVS